MDITIKGKGKKSLINKTWERCKSIGRGSQTTSSTTTPPPLRRKSKSWSGGLGSPEDLKKNGKKGRVAPEGCFSVYVGQQRQRFVIKTEYANHPLFKMLLEEAEKEYGYNSGSPLALPCNVDIFCKVLVEMDDERDEIRQGCSFAKGYGSYRPLCPSPMVAINQF
uniref:PlSAUR1 protein n=1 Tax=Paeonia lactiflora TaxID=35924 RepID=A0AA49K7E9_PAELC|nr:PlSAUR1 protein [Paeonia lactiflora]